MVVITEENVLIVGNYFHSYITYRGVGWFSRTFTTNAVMTSVVEKFCFQSAKWISGRQTSVCTNINHIKTAVLFYCDLLRCPSLYSSRLVHFRTKTLKTRLLSKFHSWPLRIQNLKLIKLKNGLELKILYSLYSPYVKQSAIFQSTISQNLS